MSAAIDVRRAALDSVAVPPRESSDRTPDTAVDRVARTVRPAAVPMRSAASMAPSTAFRARLPTSAPMSRPPEEEHEGDDPDDGDHGTHQ
jgi:hypothetical protein